MSSAEETRNNNSDDVSQTAVDDDGTLVQDETGLECSAELSRRGEEAPAAVPGYEILRCLGEGAYGSVWLAREQNTGRQVAIKFYIHRRGLDWSLLNREVEKLAVLYTSRHIVRLLEVGWDSEPPYYVMEYLENGSLSSYLTEGALPAQEAVRIVKSVLAALIHAHGAGILHCDLKPANVLLDASFEPRICDFGQSRLSDEQHPALGTLFYMAPEQADLDAVPDARWDVYALGALFYHILCGEAPYRTPENEQRISSTDSLRERLAVYRRLLKEQPTPSKHRKMSGVDKRLGDIVERCLQTDPHKRYPNAQAVLDELEVRDRNRSRRPLVALGVVVPALLLAFLAPFAKNVMQEAVQTAQQTLTQRALESDSLTARILARSLARDLEDRKFELVRTASDLNLRKQLTEAMPRSPETSEEIRNQLFSLLKTHRIESQDYRRDLGLSKDASWFFTDHRGIQRWREPFFIDTIDKDFSFREYFSGLPEGENLGHPIPITKPHITQPFRSQATNRFMVAISVPVFDPAEPDRVIGVLARTTHLGELLNNYEETIRTNGSENGENIDRVVALVERDDWKLLDHPWMTKDRLQNLPENVFGQLTLNREIIKSFKRSIIPGAPSVDTIQYHEHYLDPVAEIEAASANVKKLYGGEWLAAFSPVQNTGWTVIVQERRPAALSPIEAMRIGLIKSGLLALVVFLGLIILAWSFVWRALNERSLRISTVIVRNEHPSS